jgi:uncharacterized protein YbjT (DUF2867 family)
VSVVLVAGATGQLGRCVVRELAARGHRVRALTRRPASIDGAETAVADATRPETLPPALEGVEVVVSALGQLMALKPLPEKRPFAAIDHLANRNLLRAAQQAGARRFVYVSLFGADALGKSAYTRAHEAFVADLRASGIEHTALRPTGFFATFAAAMATQRAGWALVFGDGRARTNPIHEADLAGLCADAVEPGTPAELPCGGPDTFTRDEIAQLGFAALARRGRVLHAPPALGRALAAALHPFDARLAELLEFGVAAMTHDGVAPPRGTRRLGDYLREAAAGARSADC